MHPKTSFIARLGFLALGLLLSSGPARATERHFTYTYQSGVLEPGAAEFEPWTTFRLGRDHYYSRIDTRLELELGLSERLQTSIYWNTSALSADVEDPTSGALTRQTEFAFESVSSEWKYKLSDPVADAIGSALYLEGSLGPSEAEIEGKLILDKQYNRLLLAANLVGEHEWVFTGGDTETEVKLEADVGAAYFVTPSFTAGLEVRPVAELRKGELESVAIYAGPTVSAMYDRWWLAVSVLPQVFSPKNEKGDSLDLEDNEYVQARVLAGVHW